MSKILYIDDEQKLREKIAEILTEHGFEVSTAANGIEGLRKINENEYDLIISDIMMPEMDGYTMLEEMRKNPVKGYIPVILVTVKNERDNIRHGMNIGADDYITKPFSNKELLEAIESRLKRQEKINNIIEAKYKNKLTHLDKTLYYYDFTGLPNKLSLDNRLKELAEQNRLCILIVIEIDDFEYVSCILPIDDIKQIIKNYVTKIQSCMSENQELFQIAMYEFALLVYKKKDTEKNDIGELKQYIKKIAGKIGESLSVNDMEFCFTTSIGISVWEDTDAENQGGILLQKAVKMKELVKIKGGNGYEFYSGDSEEKISETIGMIAGKYIHFKIDKEKSKKIKKENIFEKELFFLYPHQIVAEEIIKDIILNGYTAYLIKDHIYINRILQKHPNSILFINIDAVFKEDKWEKYITSLTKNINLRNIRIGIITYFDNTELKHKYLTKLMIKGGFVKLKGGMENKTGILLKILDTIGAKGRREYVRVRCYNKSTVLFNVRLMNKVLTGKIHDISIAGMACSFADETLLPVITVDTIIKDVQLQLSGFLCLVSGKVVAIRNSPDKRIFVVLFDKQKSTAYRYIINNFICKILQENIENEIDELK